MEPIAIYRPIQRIDASNASAAEQDVQNFFEQGTQSMLIDLSDVTYLSSAGLRVLLIAAKTAKARGGQIALASVKPTVKDIITMSGFDKLMAICVDREAGLAHLQSSN